jgi:hypothetical protein
MQFVRSTCMFYSLPFSMQCINEMLFPLTVCGFLFRLMFYIIYCHANFSFLSRFEDLTEDQREKLFSEHNNLLASHCSHLISCRLKRILLVDLNFTLCHIFYLLLQQKRGHVRRLHQETQRQHHQKVNCQATWLWMCPVFNTWYHPIEFFFSYSNSVS